jgi:hypothetical protein
MIRRLMKQSSKNLNFAGSNRSVMQHITAAPAFSSLAG